MNRPIGLLWIIRPFLEMTFFELHVDFLAQLVSRGTCILVFA